MDSTAYQIIFGFPLSIFTAVSLNPLQNEVVSVGHRQENGVLRLRNVRSRTVIFKNVFRSWIYTTTWKIRCMKSVLRPVHQYRFVKHATRFAFIATFFRLLLVVCNWRKGLNLRDLNLHDGTSFATICASPLYLSLSDGPLARTKTMQTVIASDTAEIDKIVSPCTSLQSLLAVTARPLFHWSLCTAGLYLNRNALHEMRYK